MVIFDQLRVSDDGRQLFINAHVNRATTKDELGEYSPFKNVYITKVTIIEGNNASELLSIDDMPKDKYLYTTEYNPGVKEIDLVVDVNSMMRHGETDEKKFNYCQEDMYRTLFLVYVQTSGEADSCLPCHMTKPVTVAATFDESAFYQKVMNYTRELAQDCTVPQGFTDFILLWNAFKASVETEHWLSAIDFYNKMFGGSNAPVAGTSKGCGCHG